MPYTTFRNAILTVILRMAAGCTQQMADQPRYDPLEKSDFFPDTMASRPLPSGVISRDHVEPDEAAAANPLQLTRDLFERGQQRYNIYCTPCHDYVGT